MEKATPTSFAKWRRKMGYTQKEAARALGKSRITVIRMERGTTDDGNRYAPERDTRILMAALAAGFQPKEWPE